LNLITEEYYEEALLEAKQKDAELLKAIKEKKTHTLGRLHGIPVSIKDHISEKKRHSTVGVSHFADFVGKEDAIVVQLIRQEGGIPFVKSNNP
jgi:amidase